MSSEPRADGATEAVRIRVMLVDDHGVVRRGMHAYLDMLDDIEVVGEAADGRQAVDRLALLEAEDRPAGCRVDGSDDAANGWHRGNGGNQATLSRGRGGSADQLHRRGESPRRAAGRSRGYLLKDAEADEVAQAVRAAHRGEVHLDPAVAKRLMQSLRSPKPHEAVDPLTDREREVLVLVAQGRANKEIGKHLGISERTARTHVSNILGKLALNSRTQAALYAVREGLVPETRKANRP